MQHCISFGSVTASSNMDRRMPRYDISAFLAGNSGTTACKRNNTAHCVPVAIQYTTCHAAKLATTPEITRPRRTPSDIPDHTMEIANARRSGGARSAASGITICGATEDMPTRNVSTSKVTSDLVSARPTVSVVEVKKDGEEEGPSTNEVSQR
jgi:hypothetical protein